MRQTKNEGDCRGLHDARRTTPCRNPPGVALKAQSKRRRWGYRRLSLRMKEIVKRMAYEDEARTRLLRETIREASLKEENVD